MFDIAPSEFMLVALAALIFIGPKDLPKAMRIVGYWVGKARGVSRQFRSGFDQMVREAELDEMETKWKAENERIMREHPAVPDPTPEGDAPHAAGEGAGSIGEPVHVERPMVAAAAAPTASVEPVTARDSAPS